MSSLKQKRIKDILLFFIAACILSFALNTFFEKSFESTSWKKKTESRYEMVDDLIESQLLMGKTKNEVIRLLGQPNMVVDDVKNYFTYKLGEVPSFFDSDPEYLFVSFNSNRVDKVSLAIK